MIIKNLLYLLLFSHWALCQNQEAKVKKSDLAQVELQWEDISGAFMYEVEIINSKNKLLKKFISKTSLFKFKTTSGLIKVRGRVVDIYGKKGNWSTYIDVTVPPGEIATPDKLQASEIKIKPNPKTSKGEVKLEWPIATQAIGYKLIVKDQAQKIVSESTLKNNSTTVFLNAGHYTFSVIPFGNDSIEGKEYVSNQKITVGNSQLQNEVFDVKNENKVITISWTPKQDIKIIGQLQFAYHLSDTWLPVNDAQELVESPWLPNQNLKPGRYRAAIWSKKENWVDSETFYYEFVVKPTEDDLHSN